LDRFRTANTRDDAVLEDAQDFRLGVQAHVADLVEEERAPVRLFELPCPVNDGAGEPALHVAEQLTLNQLARDGCTRHLDKRLVRSRRLAMDRTSNELLAGTILARDEHARRRATHL